MKETLKFTTKAKMATLQETQTHRAKIEDEWDKGTLCISYKLGKKYTLWQDMLQKQRSLGFSIQLSHSSTNYHGKKDGTNG